MTDLVDRLEEVIRASDAPRAAMFQDLSILAYHNWVPYKEGEGEPRCLMTGDPFPCLTVRSLAAQYGCPMEDA